MHGDAYISLSHIGGNYKASKPCRAVVKTCCAALAAMNRTCESGVKLGSACRLPLADSEFQDPIQIVRIRFEKRTYNNYYKLRKLIRGTNL